jgi:hypothetical protein
MKISNLLPVALFAALATACSEEDTLNTPTSKDYLEASMNQGDTRTYLAGDNASVYWSDKDQILVYTTLVDAMGITSYKLPYELNSASGATSGIFGGDYDATKHGDKLLAFYPYTDDIAEGLSYDADYKYLQFTLPYLSEWKGETDLSGFPMVGLFDADNASAIQFRNAGAVLDLTIKNIPAGYNVATLTSKDDGVYLAGPARIGFRPEYTDVSGDYTFGDVPTSDAELFPHLKVGNFSNGTLHARDFITWAADSEQAQTLRILIPLPLGATYNLELAVGTHTAGTDWDASSLKLKTTLSTIVAERNTRFVRTVTWDIVTGGIGG